MKYCKGQKIIESNQQKFKKRMLYCWKPTWELPCVESKDVGDKQFIMKKDNPVVFNNGVSSVLKYWKSVGQKDEIDNRPGPNIQVLILKN